MFGRTPSTLGTTQRVPVSTDPRALRYLCSVCQHRVHLNATACPSCGAKFAGVQDAVSGSVAPAALHTKHIVPATGFGPASLPREDASRRCTCCDQPIDMTTLACEYCGHLSVGRLGLLILVSLAVFLALPIIAPGLGSPSVGFVTKWLGLIGGGIGLLWSVRAIGWARSWPRRSLIYTIGGLLALAAILHTALPTGL